MSRDRFTDLMFTVDPHKAPEDDADAYRIGEWLLNAVKDFVTAPVLKAVIPCEDPSKLKRAQMVNLATELGDRYGRVHVHFNLNLTHRTKVYLKHPDGREINDEVQKWFNQRLGTSCWASVRLADTSRPKNYATKAGTDTAEPAAISIGVGRSAITATKD